MTDIRENKPSASELYRLVACQGYAQYKREIGPLPESTNEDAKLGTLSHEVLREEGQGIDRLPTDHSRWVITESMSIRDRFVSDIFGESPAEVIRERRFWMLDKDGNRIFSGQLDYCAINRKDGIALVVDYKALFGDTDSAEENWQLLSLSACLKEELKREGVDIKTVYAAIVQPPVSTNPSLVRYEEQQLNDIGLLVRRKLRESEMVGAPRTPGRHCKFCPLSSRCPEAQAMSVVLYHGNALDRVSQLGPEEIARLLPTFPVVNRIMEAVKVRAEEMAASGLLPGHEMRDGYSVTVVSDIPGFYAKMQEECGVTRDEFFRNLKVTKEGLEELFRERYAAATGCSKKRASERFKELVAEFGEQRPTKARLVTVKEKAQLT